MENDSTPTGPSDAGIFKWMADMRGHQVADRALMDALLTVLAAADQQLIAVVRRDLEVRAAKYRPTLPEELHPGFDMRIAALRQNFDEMI